MRMRKKKHAAERINACSDINITEPLRFKGKWDTFSMGKELCLEIGCGKGSFILESAKRNPDKFYIAMEKVPDVIVIAMEKIASEGLANVRFICGDAGMLTEIFSEGEISEIYLNFSDPWPKLKHHKRRLTYRTYLEIYKKILKNDGCIYFKTDNRPLFDFSLNEFRTCGFSLSDITYDLHHSEYAADNIVTEYEKTFSEKGFLINRLCAKLI